LVKYKQKHICVTILNANALECEFDKELEKINKWLDHSLSTYSRRKKKFRTVITQQYYAGTV